MRFEIRYLAVFQPGSDPTSVLSGLLRQVYEDETGEAPTPELIAVLLTDIHQRELAEGQVVTRFAFADDRPDEEEAVNLHEGFQKALSGEPLIEHILKFGDTFQLHRYQQYA